METQYIARHFWIQEPGRGEIRSGPLDPPGRDEVLVRTLYSGISRGTESLVYRGRVPESQRMAMRAPFQEGDFPGPVKYGYMSVGVVEEERERERERERGAPAEVEGEPVGESDRLQGRTVFCLHPHQDLYVVPRSAVAPLPEGVPPGRAILAANMETAMTALWDADGSAGADLAGADSNSADSGAADAGGAVIVVGAGVVGLLIGWLCRRWWGVVPTMVDVDPEREAAARCLDLEFSTREPAPAAARRVFHASGTQEGLGAALRAVEDEGTVVEVSWFGDRTPAVPLGEDFHARRLTLKSSQVGSIPPSLRGEWTPRRRLGAALDLLRSEELDVLISGERAFEDLPRVMDEICGDEGRALCHRIRYPQPGR